MYSEKSHRYLQKTVLDGFFTNHEGIKQLRVKAIVQDAEYIELLEKNVDWLIQRIKEFRIAEKIVCIFFALLFGYLQVNGEDIERGRRSRSRTGRRRNEYVNNLEL